MTFVSANGHKMPQTMHVLSSAQTTFHWNSSSSTYIFKGHSRTPLHGNGCLSRLHAIPMEHQKKLNNGENMSQDRHLDTRVHPVLASLRMREHSRHLYKIESFPLVVSSSPKRHWCSSPASSSRSTSKLWSQQLTCLC